MEHEIRDKRKQKDKREGRGKRARRESGRQRFLMISLGTLGHCIAGIRGGVTIPGVTAADAGIPTRDGQSYGICNNWC